MRGRGPAAPPDGLRDKGRWARGRLQRLLSPLLPSPLIPLGTWRDTAAPTPSPGSLPPAAVTPAGCGGPRGSPPAWPESHEQRPALSFISPHQRRPRRESPGWAARAAQVYFLSNSSRPPRWNCGVCWRHNPLLPAPSRCAVPAAGGRLTWQADVRPPAPE